MALVTLASHFTNQSITYLGCQLYLQSSPTGVAKRCATAGPPFGSAGGDREGGTVRCAEDQVKLEDQLLGVRNLGPFRFAGLDEVLNMGRTQIDLAVRLFTLGDH